jgi:hypothetical protein
MSLLDIYCKFYIESADIQLSLTPFPDTDTKVFSIVDPLESKNNFSLHLNVKNILRKKYKIPNETLVSLHKSNLQKAIRLGNRAAALTSLDWLFRSHPIGLFRRLSIILIEDSCLHLYSPLIVIYSIAYEYIDIKFDKTIYSQLKQVVLDTIDNKIHQRTIVYKTEKKEDIDFLQNLDKQRLFMFVRYCYGGLPGDMKMSKQFIQVPNLYYTIPNTDLLQVEIDKTEERYLNQAVDFHVFPNILTELASELERNKVYIDKNTIKSTMWNCRSRTNFREDYVSEVPEWWTKLQPYLDKLSKQYWGIYLSLDKVQLEPKDNKKLKKPNTLTNYFS